MAKPVKSRKIVNPLILTMAALAAWGAAHVPEQFTVANIGVWICGAVTVALLTRAALALGTPLIGILGVLSGRALKSVRQDGAES